MLTGSGELAQYGLMVYYSVTLESRQRRDSRVCPGPVGEGVDHRWARTGLGKEVAGQRIGQWETRALKLTGNGHGDDRPRAFVEYFSTGYQNGSLAGLFPTTHGLEVGPVDVLSQDLS